MLKASLARRICRGGDSVWEMGRKGLIQATGVATGMRLLQRRRVPRAILNVSGRLVQGWPPKDRFCTTVFGTQLRQKTQQYSKTIPNFVSTGPIKPSKGVTSTAAIRSRQRTTVVCKENAMKPIGIKKALGVVLGVKPYNALTSDSHIIPC